MSSRRDERVVAGGFAATFAASVGLAAVYWRGGQPQAEGVLLAVAAAGFCVGMVTWAHRLMPTGEATEDRPVLTSPLQERRAFGEDLDRNVITRRRLITRTLGAGIVAFGAALVFPIRSLGPNPSDEDLNGTPWRAGLRVVTEDGLPVRPTDVPPGGLVTVFPVGAVDSETGQVVLVNVSPQRVVPVPGRESWSPDGLVAYSKVCTHAGCPVGLYEAKSHQLLCPCHQSTFDALRGAQPVFGPAAVPLPQLPLGIDAAGYLVATGGLSGPPGPSFWNRRT